MDNSDKFNWITRKEAAEYLRVSVSTMAHWVQTGMGPRHFIAGGKARYLREDLDCWAMGKEFEPMPMKLQNYVLRKRKPKETEREQAERICQSIVEEVQAEIDEDHQLLLEAKQMSGRDWHS